MNPYLQLLVPVVAKLVTDGIRAVLPKIPKALLPYLSLILGIVASAATGVARPVQGAVLGAAGVFVHEVVDTVRKSITTSEPPQA